MQNLDLGGTWNICSSDGLYKLEGKVPGSLFADLESQGQFGVHGLFWQENNREALAVADRDFVFSRSFSVDSDWVGSKVLLEAQGLDTFAEITLNGKKIAQTKNMHRRYQFEVGSCLIPGDNKIEILFKNSLDYCRQEIKRRAVWFSYEPSPEICFPGFNMIRKSHCSYGWDWGPIIPDVGIWRDIRLVRYEGARIENLRVVQHHGDSKVELEIQPQIQEFDKEAYTLKTTLIHPSGFIQEVENDGASFFTLKVDNPQLWWPQGLGAQPLYTLKCRIERKGAVLHSYQLRLGLRTLTVNRESDQWGQKFEFEVNGQSFFARGGDYIPEDVALPRVTKENTEKLIKACVWANFNCIRVWGGGVYPSDDFYDLCDQYGLVVWQDLMFACAAYDVKNPEFQSEIVEEVRDNLLRLRHHASLGLICGNNEMEMGYLEWGINPTEEMKQEYLTQYEKLFPQIMKEVCPEVFYWPASPSSGGGFDDPNAPDRGDCHFWAVWHGNKDFSEYTKHYFRFMSEFGFESFPSVKTIESFTEPGDRNLLSPVMEDHQRCVGGNAKILTYLSKNFRYPKGFAQGIYLSQVSQAEAQRSGIEHWRRNRGRCMGSVYWQLNDNWPVASWSSIDSDGRWKLLHYSAKKAYAPQLLSSVAAGSVPAQGLPDGNGHFTPVPAQVQIHFSNEDWSGCKGTMNWELRDFKGSVLESGAEDFQVEPFSSQCIKELDFSSRLKGRFAPRNAVLFYKAEYSEGKILEGVHTFVPYKMLQLEQEPIKVEWVPGFGSWGCLKVTSPVPALFVTLDNSFVDIILEDNGFYLDGTKPKEIEILQVYPFKNKGILPHNWQNRGWTVQSLSDSY